MATQATRLIAADSSSLARFLAGIVGRDTELLMEAIARHQLALPPIVVAEVLSAPSMTPAEMDAVDSIEILNILDGHWQRAGDLRRGLLTMGLKANLADTLTAQSCIDHDLPLITYDRDFRNFAAAGLKLL